MGGDERVEADGDAPPRSRRAFLGTAGRATAGLLAGLVGGTAATDRGAARQSTDLRQFFGTANTSLEFFDDDGETVYAEEYENDIFVTLTRPLASGFQRETNPFHLRIDPAGPLIFPDDTITGELQVDSAYNYGTELVQFWSVRRESANEFSGTLTTAGTGSPPDRNWISVRIPGQEVVRRLPLSEATTLDGFIENGVLFVSVLGNTVDRNTPFTVEIVAPQE